MSLRDLVKQRIIKNIIQDAQSKMKKKYTVIVADDTTIKILHHCFRMHELNELDIGVVLNVKFPRERVKVSPIYFLSANYDSAKHMCGDYANPKETRYAAPVHVYFNSKVPKKIIELIKTENVRKYMKTLSEIHCDFLVLEHRVFSFYGGYNSFNNLYVEKENRSDELALRAQQLVGLCLSLEEEPAIRYSTNSRNAKTLAELFNQQMNDTKQSLTNWDSHASRAHESVLFILDRKDDPLTPFLHSLSFQAMVYDLLSADIDVAQDKIRGLGDSDKNESRSMPDENDEVWIKYRHEFIGEVVQKLPTQFNNWQTQNAVVKMKKKSGDDTSTKDLILAARDMPQYQKLVKQYTTNINMASKLMDIFKNTGLRDVIQLEQDMATGIDEDGKKIDRTKMQQLFSSVLMDADKEESLKLRTFMMYVISQNGMKPEQRKTLLKQSGFSETDEETILNLGHLGVTLTSSRPAAGAPSGGCKNYWKYVTKYAKQQASTTNITRYTSYLEWILTQHNESTLSEKDFEWISKPNASNQKKTRAVKSYRKHARNKANEEDQNQSKAKSAEFSPRYIIFVLGGVSYEEIKTCYEFSSKNQVDIFVGSTLIYSPQQYLKCFKKGNKDRNENDEEEKGDL